MKFIKINNLMNMFGQADYKGLDITKFIPGSQVYPKDLSYCLVATTEEATTTHTDVVEMAETEYVDGRNVVIAEEAAARLTAEQKIDVMQKAIDDLILGGTL